MCGVPEIHYVQRESTRFVLGSTVQSPGEPCGNGLTEQAARDLCLKTCTPVGTSLIDAHAGGLGVYHFIHWCLSRGHLLFQYNFIRVLFGI